MCGIVGYIGQRKAYPILIKGLKRLEYRGYDSAGVALISDNRQLNVYKAKGKVSELETFVAQKDISGNIGIAHTRWATHGEPCSVNAHPHYSSSERLALIHNGIIENYAVLKEKLQAKGYVFKSSTDTEVLVQLIEYIQVTNHIDLLTAVQLALQEVIGAYAIAVLDKDNPDGIIAARKSSPLAAACATRCSIPCRSSLPPAARRSAGRWTKALSASSARARSSRPAAISTCRSCNRISRGKTKKGLAFSDRLC